MKVRFLPWLHYVSHVILASFWDFNVLLSSSSSIGFMRKLSSCTKDTIHWIKWSLLLGKCSAHITVNWFYIHDISSCVVSPLSRGASHEQVSSLDLQVSSKSQVTVVRVKQVKSSHCSGQASQVKSYKIPVSAFKSVKRQWLWKWIQPTLWSSLHTQLIIWNLI